MNQRQKQFNDFDQVYLTIVFAILGALQVFDR